MPLWPRFETTSQSNKHSRSTEEHNRSMWISWTRWEWIRKRRTETQKRWILPIRSTSRIKFHKYNSSKWFSTTLHRPCINNPLTTTSSITKWLTTASCLIKNKTRWSTTSTGKSSFRRLWRSQAKIIHHNNKASKANSNLPQGKTWYLMLNNRGTSSSNSNMVRN